MSQVGQLPTPHVIQPRKWWNKYTFPTIPALMKSTADETKKKAGMQSINQNEKVCRWRKKITKNSGKQSLKADYGELLPQIYAQYALYGMFLLHICAEMVLTWNYSHNTCRLKYCQQELLPQTHTQYTLWDVSLTQAVPIGASPNKLMPSTFSTGCFSYTSRLKSCLPGSPPINLCPVHSLRGVSLACSGWNGVYVKLPQTHAHSALCFSYTARLKSCRQGITPTNPCSLCSTGCSSYTSRLKRYLRGIPPTNSTAVLSRGCFSYNPGWNGAYGELLQETHAQYSL